MSIEIDLKNDNIEIDLSSKEKSSTIELEKNEKVGVGEGTDNYNLLKNKPQINGVILEGNKSSSDLNLQDFMNSISNSEIENILKL